MTNFTTKTQERIVYRKGFLANIHFDYFIRFFAIAFLSMLLSKNNILFNGETVGIVAGETLLKTTAIKLSLLGLSFSILIENLVLNCTFMSYKDNKTFVLLQTFFATALALLCGKLLGIAETNIISVLAIATLMAVLKAHVSLGAFSLSEFLTLCGVHLFAQYSPYGVKFNGEMLDLFMVTIIIFLGIAAVKSINYAYLKQKMLKNFFSPKNIFQYFVGNLITGFLGLPVYFICMYILNRIGWVDVLSYKQIFMLYLISYIIQCNFNFVLSSIKEKKQSYSYI